MNKIMKKCYKLELMKQKTLSKDKEIDSALIDR